MSTRPLVSIVDDDESVREALPHLIRQFGFAARAFPSAEAFLASGLVGQTSCVVLDIAVECLVKPSSETALLEALQTALRMRWR